MIDIILEKAKKHQFKFTLGFFLMIYILIILAKKYLDQSVLPKNFVRTMKFLDKYKADIFLVFLIFLLILVYTQNVNWNGKNLGKEKAEILVETMCNHELKKTAAHHFCRTFDNPAHSKKELRQKCNELTEQNCNCASCCSYDKEKKMCNIK